MEYRLTEKGRKAEIKPNMAGKILEHMRTGQGVVNASQIEYDLDIPEARAILDKLVDAGYLGKAEETADSSRWVSAYW